MQAWFLEVKSFSKVFHATHAFGRSIRIAAEQRVIFGRAQEVHDSQFLDQLIPKLLRAGLVQRALV